LGRESKFPRHEAGLGELRGGHRDVGMSVGIGDDVLAVDSVHFFHFRGLDEARQLLVSDVGQDHVVPQPQGAVLEDVVEPLRGGASLGTAPARYTSHPPTCVGKIERSVSDNIRWISVVFEVCYEAGK